MMNNTYVVTRNHVGAKAGMGYLAGDKGSRCGGEGTSSRKTGQKRAGVNGRLWLYSRAAMRVFCKHKC